MLDPGIEHKPRVSIVIPSYNSARWAQGAVDSVLAQSVRDLEVILVDDGSRPAEIVQLEALARRERVVLLRQEHAGVAKARRRGWEAARGEFVAFLDDDDRYRPTYVQKCLEGFEAHPACGAAYTRYATISPAGEPLRVLPRSGYSGWIFEHEVAKGIVKLSTLMVRRSCLLELGGLIENFKTSTPKDLVLRLSYDHDFCFVDEVLVDVTMRPDSLSRDTSRRHENRVEILKNILSLHPDMKPPTRRIIRSKIGKYCLKAARRRQKGGDLESARILLRQSLAYRRSPHAAWQLLVTSLRSFLPRRH